MILFAAYRDWAISAINQYDPNATIAHTSSHLSQIIEQDDIELILFCGWSELVRLDIYNVIECWCYHPSSLPKFRGGSPIQNQIISGLAKTNGSLFRMSNEIDAGDIIWQEPLDLSGDLSIIFTNLSENLHRLLSICLGQRIKNNNFYLPQAQKDGSYYRRRKPEQSRITKAELVNMTGKELYDFVRCLQYPYPQAYIEIDGHRFYLDNCEKKCF